MFRIYRKSLHLLGCFYFFIYFIFIFIFFIIFLKFYFIFKLYIIVLVLPNIKSFVLLFKKILKFLYKGYFPFAAIPKYWLYSPMLYNVSSSLSYTQ